MLFFFYRLNITIRLIKSILVNEFNPFLHKTFSMTLFLRKCSAFLFVSANTGHFYSDLAA